jgi:ferritin-like metal-binding protein YciE
MASIPTLHALLIDEIQDLFHAENQLLKALPKMAKAATSAALKANFTDHLAETREHVIRLTEVLKSLGLPAKGKTCHAMVGLVEEGAEAIALKAPPAVRDAALIGAAQRVEHYEMAGYGTARAFAKALGEMNIVELLRATLEEEGEANRKLTEISDGVNAAALDVGGQIAEPAPKARKQPLSSPQPHD